MTLGTAVSNAQSAIEPSCGQCIDCRSFRQPPRIAKEFPMPKLAPYRLLTMLALALLPVMTVHAEDPPEVRARNAVRVLSEVMQAPDKSIPTDLLRDAHAIAVIPDMVKAGLIFGGRRGEGLISVKSPDGTWSNPSFVTLTGGSVGFQAGISSTDVILVFRTQRGVDSIVDGKFTIGADASAAAGPVGRTATAATDGQMKAEIYSYSRSRGLFAGVALDGSALRIDYDANTAIYGSGVTPRRIFEGGVKDVPGAVVDFRDRLEEYTQR
jgi:lipid-binding SYLF domain-containing protein